MKLQDYRDGIRDERATMEVNQFVKSGHRHTYHQDNEEQKYPIAHLPLSPPNISTLSKKTPIHSYVPSKYPYKAPIKLPYPRPLPIIPFVKPTIQTSNIPTHLPILVTPNRTHPISQSQIPMIGH